MKTPAQALRRPPRSGARQRGLTLIELMVSMVIMLIIVAALITLFLDVTRTNREMVKVNRQIESGRLAVFVLENEFAHAGFWENYMPQFDDLALTTAPEAVPAGLPPDPCLAYLPANWTAAYKRSLLDIPIQSYAAVPAGCAALLTAKQDDTDVLVVRHAETCIAGTPQCEADVAGKLYFRSSLCRTQKPSTFDLETTDAAATSLQKDCLTPAPKRRFVSDIYYIRTYADTVGDGIPTLVRSRFDLDEDGTLAHQPPVPLIEGIEGFRVELGLDTRGKTGLAVNHAVPVSWLDAANKTTPTNRGDGSPDGAFVRCTEAVACTVDQFVSVVAVKLHLLARSTEPSPGHIDAKTYNLGSTTMGPFEDRYKRHVFATTVRLNNVAGRRETPP